MNHCTLTIFSEMNQSQDNQSLKTHQYLEKRCEYQKKYKTKQLKDPTSAAVSSRLDDLKNIKI
jgi:hypothetical protein